MTEQEMLDRLNARDPTGLEALMDTYAPYISAILWNVLHRTMQKEDMEETASDVFLAAWNQSASLRPGKVKAWLGAVARNHAKNKLRQLHQTLSLEEDVIDLPGPDTALESLERKMEAELVRQAVDSLPEQDREIFLRHYYYTQTVGEIAAQMSLNVSTVKTKLRRGREKLKKELLKSNLTEGGFSAT